MIILYETYHASVAEWSIASDCKSDDFGLRRFKSLPAHNKKLLLEFFIFSSRFIKVFMYNTYIASLAQLVEQLPLKEMVVGSNPTRGTQLKQIDFQSFF
jgi:hypothetical protein